LSRHPPLRRETGERSGAVEKLLHCAVRPSGSPNGINCGSAVKLADTKRLYGSFASLS
jgi:hypothetical protein